MEQREDARRRRTLQRLSDTMYALLEMVEVEDIGIQDICKAASVSRANFYNCFAGKAEFLAYCAREPLRRAALFEGDLDAMLEVLLEFSRRHRRPLQKLMQAGGGFTTGVEDFLSRALLAQMECGGDRAEEQAHAVAASMASLLQLWAEGQFACTQEETKQYLLHLTAALPLGQRRPS